MPPSQIELTKGYGYIEFREDLKSLYMIAGCEGTPVVFLFADTQIVVEAFVEDINNILNSGEVPNLFANDEWEKITSAVRPFCKGAGLPETKDNIKQLFVSRVRENLHIVLAMSPVGSAFRVRCRMFPSLINCCTIDWCGYSFLDPFPPPAPPPPPFVPSDYFMTFRYDRWPKEALLSVSKQFLEPLEFGESAEEKDVILGGLMEMSSVIHTSVIEKADLFFDELKRRCALLFQFPHPPTMERRLPLRPKRA